MYFSLEKLKQKTHTLRRVTRSAASSKDKDDIWSTIDDNFGLTFSFSLTSLNLRALETNERLVELESIIKLYIQSV